MAEEQESKSIIELAAAAAKFWNGVTQFNAEDSYRSAYRLGYAAALFAVESGKVRLERPEPVKMFPIQNERGAKPHPNRIPWSVAEKAYSVYASRYGKSQSLERLAERGGFGPGEMDDFYPNWREECSELTALCAVRDAAVQLAARVESFHECDHSRATCQEVGCVGHELRVLLEALKTPVSLEVMNVLSLKSVIRYFMIWQGTCSELLPDKLYQRAEKALK